MDTVKRFDFDYLKDLIFLEGNDKLDLLVSQNREELNSLPNETDDEKVVHERQRIYWVLLDLTLYFVKYTDVDLWQFEEIYTKLITDDLKDEPSFPRQYKLEFLELISLLFNDNGFYSRSEFIISLFKNLYETCEEWEEKAEIGYKFIILLASRSYDIWSTEYSTADEYIAYIKSISSNHEFTEKQNKNIEFKFERIYCDYFSIIDLKQGPKHHKRLVEIAQETSSLHYVNECCDMLLVYAAKMPDMVESNIPVLSSMMDEYLKDVPDNSKNYSKLHLNLVKIFEAVKAKNIETTSELSQQTTEIMVHHNMHKFASLNFDIIISLLIFSLDPDKIDQGKVFEMRKQFIEMVNITDDEKEHYKVCYSMIGIFGLMVQIQQAMGASIDYQLPLKYDSVLENDKLSYISFFSSLETIQDESIIPCLNKALKFWEELNFPKLQKFRLNLTITKMLSELYSQDPNVGNRAVVQLVAMINELKDEKSEALEQKYMVLLQIYTTILEQGNDIFAYVEYGEKYITIGIKYYESISYIAETAKKVCNAICSLKDLSRAEKLCQKVIDFLTGEGHQETNYYVDLLYLAITLKRITKQNQYIKDNIKRLSNLTIKVYGEKSNEYIDALKEESYFSQSQGLINQAYLKILKAYNLSTEIHGTEDNYQSSILLSQMAILKWNLQQFEDSFKMISKAMIIEEKMTSKASATYLHLETLEKNITKVMNENPQFQKAANNVVRNRKILRMLRPDTPLKVTGYIAFFAVLIGGGYYWYTKKK